MDDFTLYSTSPEMPFALNEDAWKASYSFMSQEFGPFVANCNPVSMDEAFHMSDKNTSPGFPWNSKFPNKVFLLNKEDVYWKYMEQWYEDLSLESCCFWNLFPKDEILPSDKVDAGRVRTLCGSPIEHSLGLARLSLEFNQKFYTSALSHSSAVGFSEFKGGRHQIIYKLGEEATCFEGDLTSQDRSSRQPFFEGIVNLRLQAYGPRVSPETMGKLVILYAIMIFALVVGPDGYIWQLLTGNKSGQGNTIADNTMNLFRAFAYAWFRLAPIQHRNFSSFKELVILVLYGDDSIWACKDISIEWFNGHRVAAVFLELGLHLKVPVSIGRYSWQLGFLSADSVLLGSFWLPLRDYDKMKASLLFLGSGAGVISTLDRVVGLRNSYWPNKRCNELCSLLFFSLRDSSLNLRHDVRWQAIVHSFKSDFELERLYCGLESMVQLSEVVT